MSAADVTRYYQDTTRDYFAWSRGGNMHFGLWKRGLSLVDAEGMIEAMNAEVIERLALAPRARVADLGCGLGATTRVLAARGHRPVGVTLVGAQAADARALVDDAGADFVVADYARTPFRTASFDGAFCLESACHAPGADKAVLLHEVARVLRPGARFVVADAFLKRTPLSPVTRAAVRILERMWAVPLFARLRPFLAALERAGFVDVRVDDVSWRVAPTVLRAPLVSSRFLVDAARHRTRLSAWRWKHALASVPLLISTADRTGFAYCIVTATRR